MGNSSSRHKHNKRSVGTRKMAPVSAIPPPLPPLSDIRKPEVAVDEGYMNPTFEREENIHADIDSCIDRLIKAGSHRNNIGRHVCITQPEMIAICRYAYDIFLSQPVKYKEQKSDLD